MVQPPPRQPRPPQSPQEAGEIPDIQPLSSYASLANPSAPLVAASRTIRTSVSGGGGRGGGGRGRESNSNNNPFATGRGGRLQQEHRRSSLGSNTAGGGGRWQTEAAYDGPNRRGSSSDAPPLSRVPFDAQRTELRDDGSDSGSFGSHHRQFHHRGDHQGGGGRGRGRWDAPRGRGSGRFPGRGRRGDMDGSVPHQQPTMRDESHILLLDESGRGGRFVDRGGRGRSGRIGGRGGRSGRMPFDEVVGYTGRQDSPDDDNSFSKRNISGFEVGEVKRLRMNPSFGSEGEIAPDAEVLASRPSPPRDVFSSMDTGPPPQQRPSFRDSRMGQDDWQMQQRPIQGRNFPPNEPPVLDFHGDRRGREPFSDQTTGYVGMNDPMLEPSAPFQRNVRRSADFQDVQEMVYRDELPQPGTRGPGPGGHRNIPARPEFAGPGPRAQGNFGNEMLSRQYEEHVGPMDRKPIPLGDRSQEGHPPPMNAPMPDQRLSHGPGIPPFAAGRGPPGPERMSAGFPGRGPSPPSVHRPSFSEDVEELAFRDGGHPDYRAPGRGRGRGIGRGGRGFGRAFGRGEFVRSDSGNRGHLQGESIERFVDVGMDGPPDFLRPGRGFVQNEGRGRGRGRMPYGPNNVMREGSFGERMPGPYRDLRLYDGAPPLSINVPFQSGPPQHAWTSTQGPGPRSSPNEMYQEPWGMSSEPPAPSPRGVPPPPPSKSGVEVILIKDEPPEAVPSPPPEPSEPSGRVMALTRLIDLEAQMEFAFVKHLHLMLEQKKLRAKYEMLDSLPVGIDAFSEELDKLNAQAEETNTLYDV